MFEGLYLESKWNWEEVYPVVRFSLIEFWGGYYETELKEELCYSMLMELIYKIYKIYKKSGRKVVLLVDEYDKPILDNIDKKEIAGVGAPTPEEIREVLK